MYVILNYLNKSYNVKYLKQYDSVLNYTQSRSNKFELLHVDLLYILFQSAECT